MESDKNNKRSFGKLGEQSAAKYLLQNGFKIIEMNYRSGRMGEIDIIASEAEYICFIEVKTRTNNNYGEPSEAVGHKKQNTIRKIAWTYLKRHRMTEKCIRFDIIEVIISKFDNEINSEKINLIKNAF